MPKTLLLLRHGKSDWNNAKESDYDRPLARRGLLAATRLGQYLFEEDLLPDLLVSSPAKRALQTAELVQAELTDVDLNEEESIYEADLAGLVAVVQALPQDVDTVLLVGHNPGMEELCDELSGRTDSVYKTCTLGVLRSELDSWANAGAGKFVREALVNHADLE